MQFAIEKCICKNVRGIYIIYLFIGIWGLNIQYGAILKK